MGWFGLAPQSIVDRVKASGEPLRIPTLAGSLIRGAVGFTIVSVAGFAPWVFAPKWLPEIAMYAACAVVFIGLSGLLLHRLIIGPGSLSRFYKLFGVAFGANSVLWIAAWMILKGDKGSVTGLLAGTAAMGGMIALAFDEKSAAFPSISALFVLNTAGYYAGGWVEHALARANLTVAMLLWGVFYGLGLGSGLGLALFFSQKTVRERLAKP
jgi:hypothetical protein